VELGALGREKLTTAPDGSIVAALDLERSLAKDATNDATSSSLLDEGDGGESNDRSGGE